MPQVPFSEAFRFWLKLGFISFGGPAGQIAILHREAVDRRKWITEERFFHALNYCMLLPGPEAQQLATYIGWLLHGVRGGLAAGGLFVLPSAFILAALSYLYMTYGQTPAVTGILMGFKAVVVAIVLQALIKIGKRALKHPAHVAIAIFAFAALFFGSLPFPLVILAAGLLGWAGTKTWPAAFPAPQTDASAAKPPLARTLRIISLGALIWIAPLLALLMWRGAGSLHAQQYFFFSQAALVTFGGAYAVLSYITQAVTSPGGWITRSQAIDGMALAETTPGPLIMVLQFIGFVAAWQRPEGMAPLEAALIAAAITTFTTFLPSFLFIFAGAPYVESLRGHRGLSGALAGITAAVTGVILNLSLVFAAAVFLPATGAVVWPAVLLAACAFGILHWTHLEPVWLVLASGAAGYLLF